MQCTFDHVTFGILNQQNPGSPPCDQSLPAYKQFADLINFHVQPAWLSQQLRVLKGEWKCRYKATWKSGIQTPMAQGRSTTIISMIQWTRTSRLSIKISLSLKGATVRQWALKRPGSLSLTHTHIHTHTHTYTHTHTHTHTQSNGGDRAPVGLESAWLLGGPVLRLAPVLTKLRALYRGG